MPNRAHEENRINSSKMIERLSDGFRGFPEAVVQLVENANDWGAMSIIIRFFLIGDMLCMSVTDDGSGATEEGRTAYTNCCDSEAAKDKGKKGRNGTGRLGFIWHCLKVMFETKRADGKLFAIEMTRESLIKHWFNQEDLKWSSRALPAGHAINVSGSSVTWYDLGSAGAKRKHRNASVLIKNLASRLLPNVAAKVRVIDIDGSEHELTPRELHGMPVEGEAHDVPGLGHAAWYLYVVSKTESSMDHLFIGAMGPVCTWEEFVAPIASDERYASLLRSIRAVFGHRQLVGLIDLEELNEYAVNNRKSFSADLYENENLIRAILSFLRRTVMPLVEKELGMEAGQIITSDDTTMISDLATSIHEATGVCPPRQKKAKIEIALNRRRVELEPTGTIVLEVTNPKPGARYVWDFTGSGLKLDATSGTRISVTANQVGTYTIVVREMGIVGKTPTATISVVVLKQLPFRFTRGVSAMDTHERQRLRLENTHNTSGDLQWDFMGWTGQHTLSDDGTEATITSTDVEGDFTVTVTDKQNAAIQIVHHVTVKDGWRDRAKTTYMNETEFEYDGNRFELIGTRLTAQEAVRITSFLDPGDPISQITLNFGHPVFEGRGDEVRKAISMTEIARCIAEHNEPRAKPAALSSSAALIMGNLIRKPS